MKGTWTSTITKYFSYTIKTRSIIYFSNKLLSQHIVAMGGHEKFDLLTVLLHHLFLYRGSLLTRNLADLVKKEHFILDSEYLTTLLVIVPKYATQFSHNQH